MKSKKTPLTPEETARALWQTPWAAVRFDHLADPPTMIALLTDLLLKTKDPQHARTIRDLLDRWIAIREK